MDEESCLLLRGYFPLQSLAPAKTKKDLMKVRAMMACVGFEGEPDEFVEKYNAGQFKRFWVKLAKKDSDID